jgi:hypothetical protein
MAEFELNYTSDAVGSISVIWQHARSLATTKPAMFDTSFKRKLSNLNIGRISWDCP